MIEPNDTVLFQGDSITDAGRDRDAAEPNQSVALGRGYAMLAAARLLSEHAGNGLRVLNRGISGNKVTDLAARWQADCLDLKPDVLSILIGVNDTWHGTGKNNPEGGTTLQTYEDAYRTLLDQVRAVNPAVKLVLCEPFVLRCGAVTDAWLPEMDQRRAIVRRLSGEFDATFVPFQSAMNNALDGVTPDYWAHDGVHPTLAGHQLMARLWLDVVRAR